MSGALLQACCFFAVVFLSFMFSWFTFTSFLDEELSEPWGTSHIFSNPAQIFLETLGICVSLGTFSHDGGYFHLG